MPPICKSVVFLKPCLHVMFFDSFLSAAPLIFFTFCNIMCEQHQKNAFNVFKKQREKWFDNVTCKPCFRVFHFTIYRLVQRKWKFYTYRCCCRRSPCGSQYPGASGWGSWTSLGRDYRKFYIIIWFCELWTSKVREICPSPVENAPLSFNNDFSGNKWSFWIFEIKKRSSRVATSLFGW